HGHQRICRFRPARDAKGFARPAFLYHRHLRALRLCKLQLHRHSDRRHRRPGSGAAQRFGQIRDPRHAGRDHGQPDVGIHRGTPELDSMSAKKQSAKATQELLEASAAARFILGKTKLPPNIALVLGSGLGAFADEFANATRIPYAKIPYFPRSTAIGHANQLVLGTVDGVPVAGMQGRVHLYEGYSAKQVAFPMRVFARVGVKAVILTNAAGGINLNYSEGALVVLRDHINLQAANPLVGPNDDRFGPRFPDMTRAYDPDFRGFVAEEGKRLNLNLQEGVYL